MEKRLKSEAEVQGEFFNWFVRFQKDNPDVNVLAYHVPNGEKRDGFTGARLRALGTMPGVPDITVVAESGRGKGLFIELKSEKRKPINKAWSPSNEDGPVAGLTEAQKTFARKVVKMGYEWEVCFSASEAKKVFLNFLGMEN